MLTKHDQLLIDRARLAVFVREIKRYKTMWGIPPDRAAFRNAWRATQATQRLLTLTLEKHHEMD